MSLDNSSVPDHKVGPEAAESGTGSGVQKVRRRLGHGKANPQSIQCKEVERLKTPGRHSDGGGLYLAIDDDGRRRWVFMYVYPVHLIT